jgi:hypothetical protein
MRGLALTAAGRQTLGRLHVRIYTADDYLDRWRDVFAPPATCGGESDGGAQRVGELLVAMKYRGVSRRALAEGIGADPSFVNKILTLKKACPARLLKKAEKWLTARSHEGQQTGGSKP